MLLVSKKHPKRRIVCGHRCGSSLLRNMWRQPMPQAMRLIHHTHGTGPLLMNLVVLWKKGLRSTTGRGFKNWQAPKEIHNIVTFSELHESQSVRHPCQCMRLISGVGFSTCSRDARHVIATLHSACKLDLSCRILALGSSHMHDRCRRSGPTDLYHGHVRRSHLG